MRADVLVLCYHAVSPDWPAETSVTPEQLAAQLEMLLAAGYRGATLVDALTAPPAGRTVVVTFDDAHRSVLDGARPVLDELGVPATVFVPTDYAGTDELMGWRGYDPWLGTEHEHELRCLSWEELRDLADAGWEVASHTCSHPRLTELDDDALERELVESRRVCETRLGRACVSFAYPYSDEDDRVVAAARRAGYGLAVTVARRYEPPLPLRWPRLNVARDDTVQRLRLRVARRRNPVADAAAGRALELGRRAHARVRG